MFFLATNPCASCTILIWLTITLEYIIFKTYYSHVCNHILRGFAQSLRGRVWITQSRAGRPRKWGVSDLGCLAFRGVIFESSSTTGPLVENFNKFNVLYQIWYRISYSVRFKQVWCKLWTIVWKSVSWFKIYSNHFTLLLWIGEAFFAFFSFARKFFLFLLVPWSFGPLVPWSFGPRVP